MLRGSVCLLSIALLPGCSIGDDEGSRGGSGSPVPRTIVADGETVDVTRLTEAVSGLCDARQQAASDPRAAKATYLRRSDDGVHTTTRALRRSYSRLASAVANAVERVKADLATEPPAPTLADDLGRLAQTMRRGLASLGIPTPPCER